MRNAYRLPAEVPAPARIWRKLTRLDKPVSVELRPGRTIWLRLDGVLNPEDAAQFASRLRETMAQTRERIVLDLKQLTLFETEAAQHLAETLREYRDRISVLGPTTLRHPGVAAALTVFSLYHGPGFGL